ncbi:FGGY family carbohydrate kinase [Streptomyces sp. NPDC050400]|uniref:FGGY family carbohydrate kinase n=1 Tax=Streptomyces sp. NPDC050400 TaxID=3365610 RepID=UPI0037966086
MTDAAPGTTSQDTPGTTASQIAPGTTASQIAPGPTGSADPGRSIVIGVDIGTSVTKAVAFDGDGTPLARAARPSRLERLPGGRVEQDLDDVVRTVTEVVRETTAALPEPPVAVALTGQGDGLWLRDAAGRPVRPAISWMDGRAADRVGTWLADGTIQEVYARTGSGMFPGCHAPLLAWLQEHEPEVLARAATAGYCVDAVAQRLTGQTSLDAADATLPFLDPVTRTYSQEALAACGIADQARLLPPPAPPGTVLALDRHGAELLGLPEGLPLTAGPYDLPACAIGSGVREPGDGVVIIGTTLACQVLTDRVQVDPAAEPAGMWLCMPERDRWLRAMPAMVGTAALAWVLALTGRGTDDLDGLLAASPPGAHGVTALPFLSGAGERAPFVDPAARGRLDGLTLAHTPADAVRAVCEAIGYAARHCLETAGLTGTLAACGGGSRSGPWAQLVADIVGRPVRIPLEEETGALGATTVARHCLGLAPATGSQAVRTLVPRQSTRDTYERGYAQYRAELDRTRAHWSA